MSLIEKALGKARQQQPVAAKQASESSISSQRPALRMPLSRIVDNPEVIFTDEVKKRLGLSAPADQEHQRAAEYRQIKRGVVSDIRANRTKPIVLVASALAGEGKSFTSANLARSLALEPDYSVLLLDADVIKPHLTRSMQLTDRPGLMNALVDPAVDIESLVLSTDVEGLAVLPSGSASAYATEYFASERMRSVLDTLLLVPNRIIVIDSLPLLLTTESRVLAQLAGQVLLVVRSESTPQLAVKQSVELLGEKTNVKFVLNAVVRSRLNRYFGYGYGYDYEYGETVPGNKEKS
jgi:protein-tyrosine kinase